MLALPLLPQEISTLDVVRISIKVGRVLRVIFKEHWPDDIYSGFRKRVEEIIDAESIGSDKIASCYWNAGKAVERADTFIVGFFFASLYYLSAQKALKLEDENKALTLLTYASYQLGFIDGYQDFTRHAEITIKGPSSGGQANKRIRKIVSEYLIGLLNDSPDGGWNTQLDTAEKLCEKLDDFITFNRFGKVIPDAENFIKFALKAKGGPRDAYLLKKSKHD